MIGAMTQIVSAFALSPPLGIEPQPVFGAHPPRVVVQLLNRPQQHQERRFLQATGEVWPPLRRALNQQPQLFNCHPVSPVPDWFQACISDLAVLTVSQARQSPPVRFECARDQRGPRGPRIGQ
jgi:hypothetical protein